MAYGYLADEQASISGAESNAYNMMAARGVNFRGGSKVSVWEAFRPIFEQQLGLDPGEVASLLQNGNISSTSMLYSEMRKLPSWQAQYGNIMDGRKENGLQFMSEGNIKQQRDTFRQMLEPLGVDSNKYLDGWISTGASPQEIADRIDIASEWATNQDPGTLKWLKDNYGVGKKELTAYVLDNEGEHSAAWFENQMRAAEIGGESSVYGTKIGKKQADALADKGVTREAARAAFKAAEETDTLGDRYAAMAGERGFSQKKLAYVGQWDPDSGQFAGGLPGSKKQMRQAKKIKARLRYMAADYRSQWESRSAGAGARSASTDAGDSY